MARNMRDQLGRPFNKCGLWGRANAPQPQALCARKVLRNHMNSKNIFQSIPDAIEEEIFETLIQSKNVKIERIISKGHQSPESGWHDENQNEWVILLKGKAVISYESGEQEKLVEGSFTNIPAHTKHRVSWTKPNTETVWLAVHY